MRSDPNNGGRVRHLSGVGTWWLVLASGRRATRRAGHRLSGNASVTTVANRRHQRRGRTVPSGPHLPGLRLPRWRSRLIVTLNLALIVLTITG